jgi:hypothetical protein
MRTYADLSAGEGPINERPEPSMLWIQMSDDDWKDPWLTNVGMAAFGLYWKALSWANDQTRGRDFLSAESVLGDLESWFIPEREVRGWKATREAKQLVSARIWVEMQAGYRYLYLRDGNKPKAVFEKRSKDTSRKRKQRTPQPPDGAAGRW